MKLRIVMLLGIFLSLSLFSLSSEAATTSTIDPNASVVQLLKSCAVVGTTNTLDNCFQDLDTLNSWIWGTRKPSATSPLLVKIGPGTFPGLFKCSGPNAGYVSLQGSGVGVTILQGTGIPGAPVATIDCVNMAYSHFTATNTGILGVEEEGGSSVWNDTEIDASGYAWWDNAGQTCRPGHSPGTHRFYSSKIVATPDPFNGEAVAWNDACDVSWLFSTQIQAKGVSGGIAVTKVRPIWAQGGEVHVYGGNIEALTDDGVTAGSIVAAMSTNGGKLHIHGAGIDVISQSANHIVALSANTGGLIHAVADGYFMQPGTGGTMTRIDNAGDTGTTVMAPYAWPPSDTPPALISTNKMEDGEDTIMITSTSHPPHQLVYDYNDCGSTSSWYDSTTSSCY